MGKWKSTEFQHRNYTGCTWGVWTSLNHVVPVSRPYQSQIFQYLKFHGNPAIGSFTNQQRNAEAEHYLRCWLCEQGWATPGSFQPAYWPRCWQSPWMQSVGPVWASVAPGAGSPRTTHWLLAGRKTCWKQKCLSQARTFWYGETECSAKSTEECVQTHTAVVAKVVAPGSMFSSLPLHAFQTFHASTCLVWKQDNRHEFAHCLELLTCQPQSVSVRHWQHVWPLHGDALLRCCHITEATSVRILDFQLQCQSTPGLKHNLFAWAAFKLLTQSIK